MKKGTIRTAVERAFADYRQDQDLKKFAFVIADIADYHVHYAWQRDYLDNTIKEVFQTYQDEVFVED